MIIKNDKQLKDIVKNKGGNSSSKKSYFLRMFFIDILLEKISFSPYKLNFVLKGGVLIASFTNIELRATRDVDTSIVFENSLTTLQLKEILKEIFSIPLDGVKNEISLNLEKIESRLIAKTFSGFSVTIKVLFGKIDETIKMDITLTNFLEDSFINYNHETFLEKKKINILSYNIEKVLSEKLIAILQWGEETTRLKDYYDIFILQNIQTLDFSLIKKEFQNSLLERNLHFENYLEMWDNFNKSSFLKRKWELFVQSSYFVKDVNWDDVLLSLKFLLEKIS